MYSEENLKHNSSWLTRTNQTWKLKVAYMLYAVLLILMLYYWLAILSGSSHKINNDGASHITNLGLLLVFVFSAAWTFLAIRCKKCKKAVVWYVASSCIFNDWTKKLKNLQSCPVCNDGGNGGKIRNS